MMEASELSYRWSPDSQDLFRKLRLVIGKGDRIAVVGPNGRGKSTFLRVLAGELSATEGEVRVHNRTRTGFFGQTNVQRLESSRTVVEELLAVEPDRSLTRARSVSGTMMFEGDSALKKVSVLSGGEKSRVLLGRLLLQPHNILLLDEPTNHLDMDSCEALLDALETFEGAVVIVTHNEMFLHSLAEKLLVFDRGRANLFEGTYQDFLSEVGWESEEETENQGGVRGAECVESSAKGEVKISKKETRKERVRLQQERARITGPLQKRIKDLERRITGLESDIERVNGELVDASNVGDGQRIAELSKQLHSLTQEVEEGYDELMAVSEELEELEREWNQIAD
jgi:ATP-binding cassette subfamily F protein 3